jgi:flagellar biogenesis protein FliO
MYREGWWVYVGCSIESSHNRVSIIHIRTYPHGWLIVRSIPISPGTQERSLVGGNKVHQHDSICIEKVGEYILVVQSTPQQGGHRSHAYVPTLLVECHSHANSSWNIRTKTSWVQQSTSAWFYMYQEGWWVYIGCSIESTTRSASITCVRSTNSWMIVISIPISLGTQERSLVGGNKVLQHDSICIEKVGEYILVVQSNPQQGQHRSHAYVPTVGWLSYWSQFVLERKNED